MYEWSLDPYHSWTDINNTHNRTSNIGNNAREKIAIAYIEKNMGISTLVVQPNTTRIVTKFPY